MDAIAPTPRNPIRAYREREELSLDELASRIGVKRNTVWRWENGRMPERRLWPAIEKATGITPSDLVRIAEAA